MANIKITELDAATTLASTDVVPVVDVSEDVTKKTTVTDLFRTVPDGTAAAPALAFSSDKANGVYLAGTDTVGISTGGTQRVTVDGSGNVTISGGLTVEGQTTTVESTIVTIDDKNIELGSVASPSNTTADGGGITLKGATDKTIKWINSTGYWTFNTGIEVGGHIQLDDTNEIKLGDSQDLRIYHDGTHSHIREVGTGDLRLRSSKIQLMNTNSEPYFVGTSDGSAAVYYNNSKKLETKSDGIDVIGEVQCDSLDVDGGVDIDGGKVVYDSSNGLKLDDNVVLRIGSGNDLNIYHNGSTSYIDEAGTGGLDIRSNQVKLSKYTGETLAQFIADGAVSLRYNNSVKFETKGDGIDVTGEVQCDSLDVDGTVDITGNVQLHANLLLRDDDILKLGNSDDLQIEHDGTDSFITNLTGDLHIRGNGDDLYLRSADDVFIQTMNGETAAKFIGDGAVELNYDDVKKFATKSDGIDVTGEVQCDSLDVDGNADISGTLFVGGDIDMNDVDAIKLGAADDLQIYHDGTHSRIDNNFNDLILRNSANDRHIKLETDDGSGGTTQYVKCDGADGAVKLYHYGSQKLNTKSDGIDVTGEVQCDTLDVDGSADFTGDVAFRGGANAVEISANSDIRFINGSWTGDYGAKIQHHSNFLYIQGGSNGIIFRDPDGTDRIKVDANGHFHPNGSNNYDLGTPSNQWRNAFFDGTVNADGLDVDGNADITGDISISGGNKTVQTTAGFLQVGTTGSNHLAFLTNGSERGRVDSSGRLMLGTTTEGHTSADDLTVSNTGGNCGITVRAGTTSSSSIFFSDGTSGDAEYRGQVQYSHSSDALFFNTAATERFRITSTGAWAIEGASNYGTSGQILTSNGNDAPSWQDAGSVAVGGASAISMNDNVKINFGAGNDLQIFHNGSNSEILNNTGDLFVKNNTNDADVVLQTDNGSGGVTNYVICDGSNGEVKIYHYGTEKFSTRSGGINVVGEVECDTLDVDGNADISGNILLNGDLDLQDSNQIKLGTSDDFILIHNGSNTHLENYTGGYLLDQNANDGYIALRSDNGSGGLTNYVFCDGSTGVVNLGYYGTTKLNTKSDGVDVSGELQCDSLDVDGNSDFTGEVRTHNNFRAHQTNGGIYFGDTTGGFADAAAIARAAGNNYHASGSTTGDLVIGAERQKEIVFGTSGLSSGGLTARCKVTASGHFAPESNNTYDLGTSSLRWRNVYTNDLNLSNEGSTNDVDGTWGNYTIQEGEDDLFLINRRNGKKYKFNLTEVS